jgi:hypothetical protein
MRHDVEPDIRGYAVTQPGGSSGRLPGWVAGWDRLVYAVSGVLTVETPDGSWVIPPDRAVWVPDGVAPHLGMSGRTAIRTLYLRTGLADRPVGAVTVPPLLRELIRYAVGRCPLYLDEPRDARLAGLLLDLLAELPVAPLRLPYPAEPRARALAEAIRTAPGSPPPPCNASRRTLERLFKAETGLTIGQYRERARLLAALPRLAGGEPVARVAVDVGYSTPSAFGAMFKRVLGTSPTRYFSAP